MSTERFELIAPCHFGLEAVLKREILDLGYEISKVEDGKVTFLADAQGIADANVFLRTTERILLNPGSVSIPKEGNPPTYAVLEDGIFSIKDFQGNIVKSVVL